MSGSKKLQLVRNIEFQNKITPTIFQSYLLQSDQITMQKPIKQTSNKILICSDDFQNILKDVFYINTSSVDFSVVKEVIIKNRVVETIDFDKNQGICTVLCQIPYRLMFYDVHIVKRINRRCLDGAYEILKLKDLDLFEKRQLSNNQSVYINDLNHLKDYFVKFKAFNVIVQSKAETKNKSKFSNLNLLDEVDTILGLELITKIVDESDMAELTGKIIDEFDKVAKEILKTFLVEGDFTYNFKCVELYFSNKEKLKEKFEDILILEIIPSIDSANLSKTEKLNIMMNKFVAKIDQLFKQSISNFENEINNNLRGEFV